MDCCSSKKDTGKNEMEINNAKQTETQKTDSYHGGCCGGVNMKLHLLLMIVVFVIALYFTGK